MTSNRRTYVIDLDFSIQIWEAGFNKIGNRSGIFVAFGVRNVTFPIIVGLVMGLFGNLIYNSANDFTLCTNLISWNQTALIIHVKKRADI